VKPDGDTRLSKTVDEAAKSRGLSVKDYLAGLGVLGVGGAGAYLYAGSKKQPPPRQPYGYY
jgi:hypothetical protein